LCVFLVVWVPDLLPDTRGGAFNLGPWVSAWPAAAACAAGFVVIWRTKRLRRTLYLWIGFVLLANALGLCISETGGARYTVGWYAARSYALLASGVLLALLLHEVLQLQRSLAVNVKVLGERAQELQTEIHRRESVERQLAQARQLELVGQLAGGVAHDFNNHLQIISMRLELLRRRIGDPQHAAEDLEVLNRTLRRAKGLTQHLLSVSGHRTRPPQDVDLAQWLPACVDMLRTPLPAHVQLRLDLPPYPCPVSIDAGELESALTNLIANARDANTGADGHIDITLRRRASDGRDPTVELIVRDHGCGMSPDLVERVFEPFFTTKAPGSGYGLGLSQVQAFAARSGGIVSIESRPGAGTEVRLSFPEGRPSTAVVPSPSAPAPASGASDALAGQSVLVGVDNADVADSTAALLENFGMTVLRAANGDEATALMALGDSRPRLVLTDIMMAGSATGLALARQLRHGLRDVAIVLCTGYSRLADEASQDGFVILLKPYRADELRRALTAALGQRR
jgi:signal transduction histidine kinase